MLLCACLLVVGDRLDAAPREDFESVDVSWRLADYDGVAKVLKHERDFHSARTGRGCEHLQVWAKQATYAYLAHQVEPTRIIDELVPSVWVKANRPGLHVLARVVLPRTEDKNGKPLTLLLPGDFYTDVSAWQQLSVPRINKLLTSAVIRHRQRYPTLDEREAYLDHIVINAYGGPGVTEIWTDDLDAGSAASVSTTKTSGDSPSALATRPLTDSAPLRIELRGSMVLADGRPFFARIIEHNGEAFGWLKELGFNTIWLRNPPSSSELIEADHANVWLLCPPPIDANRIDVRTGHQRVLAWVVDSSASADDFSAASRVVSLVHRDDPGRRPVVHVESQETAGSSVGDIAMIGRRILGTSFDLRNYGDWLRQRTRDAAYRPFWGTVQTEPSVALQNQFLLGRSNAPAFPAARQQIQLAAFETVAAGARGVCFRSRTRLDGRGHSAVSRAKTLQLINAELSLVAPWAAGGEAKRLPVPDQHTYLAQLETPRSRLLIATRYGSNDQYEPTAVTGPSISFSAHGVRLTDRPYALTTNGLQPLLGSHVTGARISLQPSDAVSLVLLTEDALAISRVGRDLSATRDDRAGLRLELARMQLNATDQVVKQIGRADAHATNTLETARGSLEQAEQLLRGGDFKRSVALIQDASRAVQELRRSVWELEVRTFTSAAASPLCMSFATLPLHRDAARYFATGQWSENQLHAGSFESLDQMLRRGWRQHGPMGSRDEVLVELTRQSPAAGRSALRLVVQGTDSNHPGTSDRSIEITSPAISVQSGQVVRIRGWIDMADRHENSSGTLLIRDSMTGDDLAERIDRTNGWQEFTLYRRCPQDGDIVLTFTLTGDSEVRLDDVSVCVLQ